jgi:hypothetical protein
MVQALSVRADDELLEVPVEVAVEASAMKEPVQLELNFNPDEDL